MGAAFVIVTPEELRALVREAVRQEVARPEESEIMTCEQVATLLQVDPESVRKYTKRNGLPFMRLGGHELRFRRSAVLEWLAGKPVRGIRSIDGGR